ncbi:hypothetical protein DYH09_35730 [bacterium CPR1]|nr:hypothetical protein [bacterium CPR1]
MQVSVVTRAQLEKYTPVPEPETPTGYSYTDRLEATPGSDLDSIRKEGFAAVKLLGAMGGTGALGPAVATAAVAGAFYVSHKGLEGWEQRLKSDTREQVQFLRHLDQAQEKLTGVPAQPWLFF